MTTRAPTRRRSLELSAWALVVSQVAHGFTPADTDSEGYVGAVGGVVLLAAACLAVYGIRARHGWATVLTGWTGLTITVAFVAYHAMPWKSPVTNPYLGEPVGLPAWLSVGFAVGAGAWAAWEGYRANVDMAARPNRTPETWNPASEGALRE